MKVTEIEVHEISLEYQDWIAYPVSPLPKRDPAHGVRGPHRYRPDRPR